MFALLVLLSAAAGDWVEIAQHKHRQGPTSQSGHDGTTKANNLYVNTSLTERPWHRTGLPRIPNFGSVRRVHLQSKEKFFFSVGPPSEGTIVKEKPSKYGNLSVVRAPSVKVKANIEMDDLKRNTKDDDKRLYSENVNETNFRHHNPPPHFELGIKTPASPSVFKKSSHTTEKYKFFEIVNSDKSYHVDTDMEQVEIHNKKSIPSESDTDGTKLGKKDHLNIDIHKHYEENEKKVGGNTSSKITNINATRNTINKILPEDRSSPLQNPFFSKTDLQQAFKINSDTHAEQQIKIKNAIIFFEPNKSREIINNQSEDSDDQDTIPQADISAGDNRRTNTIEVIWRLMKVVADTISRNTRRSSRNKIRYLEELRNNIMANIEDRIEQAWPDDAAAGAGAEARAARRARAARGHVEFPSSESALMTISFLTFAVFLIKLVLQVIHTYKNKSMVVAPALVAAVGRAARAARAALGQRAPN